ncbi:hypothetical protein [Staphylococcus sp. IVB6227]|uniref:hypothetical protein n=1 Tax=Staphylococcus sp. IVB6227 TaxID=2989768 RepID=UPI0021CEFBC9|nr:hypothetical protein [Staphylococcus sp. IVB6227]UXR77649.1 hypothetical protein MUA92_07130 [Staphylococcus sp. IVB6227]
MPKIKMKKIVHVEILGSDKAFEIETEQEVNEGTVWDELVVRYKNIFNDNVVENHIYKSISEIEACKRANGEKILACYIVDDYKMRLIWKGGEFVD